MLPPPSTIRWGCVKVRSALVRSLKEHQNEISTLPLPPHFLIPLKMFWMRWSEMGNVLHPKIVYQVTALLATGMDRIQYRRCSLSLRSLFSTSASYVIQKGEWAVIRYVLITQKSFNIRISLSLVPIDSSRTKASKYIISFPFSILDRKEQAYGQLPGIYSLFS